jgi:2-polyprenyl-3-methyl-5-hydroxy-6-metoxy-1,4-benzoquinol methylase
MKKTLRHFVQQMVGTRSSNDHLVSTYPVKVSARIFEDEAIPDSGGVETFDTPEATALNRARLDHLDSLGLDLQGKRVLDVGCGVGHLANFFVKKGCEVVCLDGRAENINKLRSLYPDLAAHRITNVETESLSRFGMFDIVFCYGLLYHTENPVAALRNIASVCAGQLFLETMVCDSNLPILRMQDETRTLSQALGGLGCRPSPSFVVLALNRVGFKHVYGPEHAPEHPEFKFDWQNNLDAWRDGPMRAIFIASKTILPNRKLFSLLRHDQWQLSSS